MKFVPIIAATLILSASAAQAARVDMKDPRRALGREDDIRIDAQLYQDSISSNSPLNVTYQVQNLTESAIAIADKVVAVSYDEDSQTITMSIGAEIPDEKLPHLVVIAPGAKKTLSASGALNVLIANNRLARVPLSFQVRVSVLRDIAPFRDLIAQQSAPRPVTLPNALFDTWLDANDNIFCNAIPVRWNAGSPRNTISAEQRMAPAGTW